MPTVLVCKTACTPYTAVVRIGKTQRAKLLVNVDDLADYLDKESLIAREQM